MISLFNFWTWPPPTTKSIHFSVVKQLLNNQLWKVVLMSLIAILETCMRSVNYVITDSLLASVTVYCLAQFCYTIWKRGPFTSFCI